MFVAAVINAFIPIMALIIGLIKMSGANFSISLLSMLQMFLDPGIIPTLLIAIAILSVLVSIIAGLLLPGFLMAVDNGLADGSQKRGLFSEGIKRFFTRYFLMTFETSLLTVVAVVFLIISAVPAIVVTRAAFTEKPDLMLAALFIDIITVGVLFLSTTFFRVYVYMWYIAALKGERRAFAAGKAVADRKFWNLAAGLLAFDVVFAVLIYIIYLSESQVLRYVSGWLFTTAFFTTLAVYLVETYRKGTGE